MRRDRKTRKIRKDRRYGKKYIKINIKTKKNYNTRRANIDRKYIKINKKYTKKKTKIIKFGGDVLPKPTRHLPSTTYVARRRIVRRLQPPSSETPPSSEEKLNYTVNAHGSILPRLGSVPIPKDIEIITYGPFKAKSCSVNLVTKGICHDCACLPDKFIPESYKEYLSGYIPNILFISDLYFLSDNTPPNNPFQSYISDCCNNIIYSLDNVFNIFENIPEITNISNGMCDNYTLDPLWNTDLSSIGFNAFRGIISLDKIFEIIEKYKKKYSITSKIKLHLLTCLDIAPQDAEEKFIKLIEEINLENVVSNNKININNTSNDQLIPEDDSMPDKKQYIFFKCLNITSLKNIKKLRLIYDAPTPDNAETDIKYTNHIHNINFNVSERLNNPNIQLIDRIIKDPQFKIFYDHFKESNIEYKNEDPNEYTVTIKITEIEKYLYNNGFRDINLILFIIYILYKKNNKLENNKVKT